MIYFLRSGDAVKIGFAESVDRRLPSLLTGNPNAVVVLGVMDGTIQDEHALHAQFAQHRLRGEWFALCDEIRDFIEQNARPYLKRLKPVGLVPPHRDWPTQTIAAVIWVVFAIVFSLNTVLETVNGATIYSDGIEVVSLLTVVATSLVMGAQKLIRFGWGAYAEYNYRKILRMHGK